MHELGAPLQTDGGDHEEVPEYSAGATAPIEVGPNGYAVSVPMIPISF